MNRLYLDHNATAPLRPVAALCFSTMAQANPSSVHGDGRKARREVENVRGLIADIAGMAPRNVIFTSGGTEANAMAILGADVDVLLVGATEHPCVLATAEYLTSKGVQVEEVPVTSDGLVDVSYLEQRILVHQGRKTMLALMALNNETGVAHDLVSISAMVRQYDVWLHVDAVQIFGKMPIQSWAWGANSIALSAHKFGGPQGVGALLVRDDCQLQPLLMGGGQEMGRRAGTENMVGIAAMGAALKASQNEREHLDALVMRMREHEQKLLQFGVQIAGFYANRPLPVSCLVHPSIEAQLQLIKADMAGFSVSSGSACSSGKVAPSHVLTAMGFDGRASLSALRLSGGWSTSLADIDQFFEFYVHALCSPRG